MKIIIYFTVFLFFNVFFNKWKIDKLKSKANNDWINYYSADELKKKQLELKHKYISNKSIISKLKTNVNKPKQLDKRKTELINEINEKIKRIELEIKDTSARNRARKNMLKEEYTINTDAKELYRGNSMVQTKGNWIKPH